LRKINTNIFALHWNITRARMYLAQFLLRSFAFIGTSRASEYTLFEFFAARLLKFLHKFFNRRGRRITIFTLELKNDWSKKAEVFTWVLQFGDPSRDKPQIAPKRDPLWDKSQIAPKKEIVWCH